MARNKGNITKSIAYLIGSETFFQFSYILMLCLGENVIFSAAFKIEIFTTVLKMIFKQIADISWQYCHVGNESYAAALSLERTSTECFKR